MDRIRKLLYELVQIPGPSGFEGRVGERIRELIRPSVDWAELDAMGNLLAEKAGPEGAPVLMLMAHMDEISMVVTGVNGGRVAFDYVGTINPVVAVGQPVRILSEDGDISGVVSAPIVHLNESMGDLWIDVGLVGSSVLPGDPICFDTVPRWLDRDQTVLAAKAIDDRSGCAALIELAGRLMDKSIDARIVYAFTVQEEVFARGAQHAAKNLKPDWTIAVDNGFAAPPGGDHGDALQLGEGPIIRRFETIKPQRGTHIAFYDQELVRALRRCADKLELPYQVDARFNLYTDAAGVALANLDAKCASVSTPRRYAHSAIEVAHLGGIKRTIDLLEAFVLDKWSR